MPRSPIRSGRLAGLAALVGVFGIAGSACAQENAGPLAPPAGNVRFLTLHAQGTQDYICLPGSSGVGQWVFERPEARLSLPEDRLAAIGLVVHALLAVPGSTKVAAPACTEAADGSQQYCPSWRTTLDGSTVWGTKAASEIAGSAADCPNQGAIACLLVRAVATAGIPGSHSHGLLGDVTFVQRLDTVGGSTPTIACAAGQIEQVPYSADYSFFRSLDGRSSAP